MTDTLTIVDYGIGNLFNVQRAFKSVGVNATVSRDPEVILKSGRLLLPGVGAFAAGMRYLREYGLVDAILEFAASGRPILGICLGMQLLMSESEEQGSWKGLGLIDGKVVRFGEPRAGQSFKIPQIGWNSLESRASHAGQARLNDALLQGLGDKPFAYFAHSYCAFPDNQEHWIAMTRYGRDEFCSVMRRNNIWGCQFHPERSGEYGLRVLANFAAAGYRSS